MDRKAIYMFAACFVAGLVLCLFSCRADGQEPAAGIRDNIADRIEKRIEAQSKGVEKQIAELKRENAELAGSIRSQIKTLIDELKNREPGERFNDGPLRAAITKLAENGKATEKRLMERWSEAAKERKESRAELVKARQEAAQYRQEARAERIQNMNVGKRIAWFAFWLCVAVGLLAATIVGLVLAVLWLNSRVKGALGVNPVLSTLK